MKGKTSQMDNEWRNKNGFQNIDIQFKALKAENERLKTVVSKINDSMTWGNAVIKVVFRDEFFEEKYRLKTENFLREILDANETFILTPQVFDKAEQEFKNIQDSFQSEKSCKSSDKSVKTENSSFLYSNKFEDVLHCDEPEIEEHFDEDKPPSMTCFNCLGDHHMNDCPKDIDRLRVAENMKGMLHESSRYHEEERKNAMKPGNISCNLKLAMGLKNDQLPQYIYTMRIIGYPPGWMNDALFETSGLALYDSEGKATADDNLSENDKKYDSSKFVEYPGFNCPVPSGVKDEWKSLNMLPMQPNHQLSETTKAEDTFNSTKTYKRKSTTNTDIEETKKVRNGTNAASESSIECSSENCSTPQKMDCLVPSTSRSTHGEKSLSISLSQSPGTPILKQGNPFERLPDANKFSQGISEHLPFENLPESVGKFDKIRGVLSDVQKKLKAINDS